MTTKKPAFTLLELVMAVTIAGIILAASFGTVGNVYFAQRRVAITQNFYAEGRYLLERLLQAVRENTIDYDRYFEEIGPPDTECLSLDVRQTPLGGMGLISLNDYLEDYDGTYEGIFYWDTDVNTVEGKQDRNLGGININGATDPCTQAWTAYRLEAGVEKVVEQEHLYLINSGRYLRTDLWLDSERVMMSQELGGDTDGDKKSDLWGTPDWNTGSGTCVLVDALGVEHSNVDFLVDIYDEASCLEYKYLIYQNVPISPKSLVIDNLSFFPAPNRDPYLAFAVDEAQVQPHAFISLTMKLGTPERYGFKPENTPEITLQTAASSRVFGNTR